MAEEPISHIRRRTPPWREPDKTECGRPLNDVKQAITRDEARKLIAKYGQQRAAFLLCMTCVQTSDRYQDWTNSPSSVIARESTMGRRGEPQLIDRELFAIAALIEAHRDEFDGYLTGLDETVSLTDRRAQRHRRQQPGGGRTPPPIGGRPL